MPDLYRLYPIVKDYVAPSGSVILHQEYQERGLTASIDGARGLTWVYPYQLILVGGD